MYKHEQWEWDKQDITMNKIALDVFIGGHILGLIGISPTCTICLQLG